MEPSRGKEIATKLLKENRLVDLYLLARFAYKVNEQLIDDSIYNKLENHVIAENLTDVHKHSYDDDSAPNDLLIEFNLEYLKFSDESVGDDSPYYQYLDSEKSMSIKALDNYQETFEYFMRTRNEQKIISPKGNGWNYKGLYLKDKEDDVYNSMELFLTRGRSSNAWNVTKGMSRVVPHKLEGKHKEVIVYGEGVVEKSKVAEIPRKNGSKFTSARMAAGSMIRTGCPDERCFQYLHYYVFNAENVADTISETLDILRAQGFETMPYLLINPEDVPENLEDFKVWLKEIMDQMFKVCLDMDLSADGLVVDVNSKHYVGSEENQYSSRNCALKFDYWSQSYYRGIIKDIIIEQKEVYASVVIEIEPINTDDSCKARRITTYNTNILFEVGASVGDEVYFERNSEAINVILRGEKLKEAKGLAYSGSPAIKESLSFN